MIDRDYTTDVPADRVHAAIVASFERHDAVPNISLDLTELPYTGGNNDILDGVMLNDEGECVDVVDLDSDLLNDYDPATGWYAATGADGVRVPLLRLRGDRLQFRYSGNADTPEAAFEFVSCGMRAAFGEMRMLMPLE